MSQVTTTTVAQLAHQPGGGWLGVDWGAVEALGVVVQVFLIVPTIVFAWHQLRTAREQRLETLRPFVVVDLEMNWLIKLHIRNTGPTPAYNVKVTFDRPLESMIDDHIFDKWREGIPTLGPGGVVSYNFDSAITRLGEGKLRHFVATVEYSAPASFKRSEPWIEEFVIDIEHYDGAAPPPKTVDDLVPHVEAIAKQLKDWGQIGGALKVSVRDGDRLDARQHRPWLLRRIRQAREQGGWRGGVREAVVILRNRYGLR